MNFADWILYESLPILIDLFIPFVSNLPWPTAIFTLTYNLNMILKPLDSFVFNSSSCRLFLEVFLFGTRACIILRPVSSPCLPPCTQWVQTQPPYCENVWCDLRVLPYSYSRSQELSFCFKRKSGLAHNLITVNTLGLLKIGFQEALGRIPSNSYCSSHSERS